MKYFITAFITFIVLGSSIAQRRDVKVLSSEKRDEMADKLIKQGGYYAAIDHYKELLLKDSTNEKYMFKLAESYFNSRDYKNSEIWYGKLTETIDLKKKKKSLLTIATFRYGESLKYNAKYDQAREVFDIFQHSNYKDVKGENYKALAKNEVSSCEFALTNKDRLKYVEITNLDSNINAAYSDFAPRLKNDSVLIYSSIQEDSVITVRHGDKHFEHTKIYAACLKDSVWGKSEEHPYVNSTFEHSANGTYSADGSRFYFTRCRAINGKMKCQIYVSDTNNRGLSKPRKLSGSINHPSHTYTQPFSAQVKNGKGQQEILYFGSDIKGGAGGMDIWFVNIDKNGKAGKPVNCGKTINSPRDEVAPYYDSESGTLYFSSNYHYGFGGYDVFRANGSGNKFTKTENLFRPVNSNLDDTYYTLNKKDKFRGFLVSNRPGGMALLSETCCDDIYAIHYRQPTVMIVNVIDSVTGKVVNDVRISVKSSRYNSTLPDSLVFNTDPEAMDNLETQTDHSLLENLHLAQNPASFYVLESNNIVEVKAEAPNYNGNRAYIKTNKVGLIDSINIFQGNYKKEGTPRFVVLNVVLGKETFKVVEQPVVKDTLHVASTLKKEYDQNINKSKLLKKSDTLAPSTVNEPVVKSPSKVIAIEFELDLHFVYDKTDIIEQDNPLLDSLVNILKDNPEVKLDFTTHTDWIGSDDYNWKLSFRRAAFINNYIVSQGISQKRVKGKGLGETKHIAPNAKPDGSDDPAGRQKNRRTDIKLISGS